MDTLELISYIASIIAVPLALYVYLASKLREKRVFTFTRVNMIFEAYDELTKDKRKPEYMELTRFIRRIDRFAAEYNERVLNRRIVKQRIGKFLIREYENGWKAVIAERRECVKRPDYFCGIEKMIESLKKR